MRLVPYRKTCDTAAFGVILSTGIPGVSITCYFRVGYSFRGPKRNLSSGASSAQSRAVQVAEQFLVSEVREFSAISTAEYRLNELLGRVYDTAHRDTYLRSASVRLALDAEQQEIHRKFESDLRDQYVLDIQQRLEIARLERFKAKILNNAGNLISYRLMRNPDQRLADIKSGEIIQFIESLSEFDESLLWVRAAKVLQSLSIGLTEAQRKDFLETLGNFARRYGGNEEAAEIDELKRKFLD